MHPTYLTPYLTAARTHGGGFGSLLWASTTTQAARFDAIVRLKSPTGQSVLDVGCGRGDFLDFCIERQMVPADYVGIEAVAPLADAAVAKGHANATIVRTDFVQTPRSMFVGADVIVVSGSLNTLDDAAFYSTIRRMADATAHAVVFNFLASPHLAAADYLHWRLPSDVLAFARSLATEATILQDYLEGDATIAMTIR